MRCRPLQIFMTCVGILATFTASTAGLLPGFDANTFPANDDSYVGPVDLGFTINYLGTNYTQFYLNNNGNITFGSEMTTYTPFGLLGSTVPIIAPFFADVDTEVCGTVTYGAGMSNGRTAYGVNWLDVGGYGLSDDLKNTFQLVLELRNDIAAGDFDIYFNYGSIQWDTGTASDDESAHVGWSDGLGTGYEESGAGVAGAYLDDGPLSLQSKGFLLYLVRSGVVTPTDELDSMTRVGELGSQYFLTHEIGRNRMQHLAMHQSAYRRGACNNMPIGGELSGGLSLYVEQIGSIGQLEDSRNNDGSDFTILQPVIGVDYALSDRISLGASISYSETDADLMNDGRLEIEGYSVSLYTSACLTNSWYVDLAGSFSDYDFEQERVLASGTELTSTTSGWTAAAQASTGYAIPFGPMVATPTARLMYLRSEIDGYTESGTGGMHVEDVEHDALTMFAGLELSSSFEAAGVQLAPAVRFFYVHEFLENGGSLETALVAAPTLPLSLLLDEPTKDYYQVEASLQAQISESFGVSLGYRGVLDNDSVDIHSLMASARFEF